MRTGEPQAARALLRPPWGLRFNAAGGAGVQVILRGDGVAAAARRGEPIHMAAGDVALIRRQRPHGMADDPSTPLYDVTIDEHDPAAHWPADGSAMDERMPGTVLLGGSYYLNGARPHPLFESLPDVIHLPARIGAPGPVRTVVELLGAEMDSERPGASAAVPALLDLLLLYTMRTWLETTTQPLGWAQALRDPALRVALGAIQQRPGEPWTVASLAREASLSRAAFARRFDYAHGSAAAQLPDVVAHDDRRPASADERRVDGDDRRPGRLQLGVRVQQGVQARARARSRALPPPAAGHRRDAVTTTAV